MWSILSRFWRSLLTKLASKPTTPTPNAYLQFFQLAIQYYVSARFAAMAPCMPVAGNLYHHAIELILKGELSKSTPLLELAKSRHSLKKTWKKFVKLFPGEDLTPFRELIRELDRFERIRYPDAVLKEGMVGMIDWNPPDETLLQMRKTASSNPAQSKFPQYKFAVTELDRFVAKLFQLCSVNAHAYIGYFQPRGREVLEYDNPMRAVWFPDQKTK